MKYTISTIFIIIILALSSSFQIYALEQTDQQKADQLSQKAKESFNKTMTETDKLLCQTLIREYLKDPQNSLPLDLIINSGPCK
jgi:BarA-like signal transduction histidine kinase